MLVLENGTHGKTCGLHDYKLGWQEVSPKPFAWENCNTFMQRKDYLKKTTKATDKTNKIALGL